MTALQYNNLINGEWMAGATYAPNVNPRNLTDFIGEYAQADVAQLNAAIDSAHQAFPAWSVSSI